jgi:hypothetical protein
MPFRETADHRRDEGRDLGVAGMNLLVLLKPAGQVAVLDPQFLKSLSRFAEPRGPIRRPREEPEPERDRADHRSDEKIRHPLPPLLLPKFTECRSRLCLELRERLAKETHRRAYAGYWRNITATPE